MRSNQQTPLAAYVAKRTLQSRSVLDQPDKVNAIFVAGKHRGEASGGEATELLAKALHPQLEDYGIRVEYVRLGEPPHVASEYVNISSDQMVLPPYVADVALREFEKEGAQPAITYLANWIRTGDGKAKIPYSTVTAVDSTARLGPLFREDGQPLKLADDQIALNSWAANDMAEQGRQLQTGDAIELVFFEPESTHGEAKEQTAKFFLADVVKIAQPGQPPTPATDSHFTPEVPGLTDKESIENWNPPFPYDARRVRATPPNNQDDQYWKNYKATPKAFVSFAAGKRLWSSRFGAITTIRIPADASDAADNVATRLRDAIAPAELGFLFRPIKRQALAASAGTTPFAGLFIGFSFFIIAAAVMLVALLFQLGIEQRASQIGVMLAVGLRRTLTGKLLSREGLIVAAVGGLAGIGLGIAYAWLMIAGLNSPAWWGQAIASPFLTLHLDNPLTFVIGLLSGVIIAWVTILWCVRRMRNLPIRNLMTGRTSETESLGAKRRRFPVAEIVSALLLISAIGLFVLATTLSGEAQAGAFFGGGAAILTAALLFNWARLRHGTSRAAIAGGGWPLARLAMRNAQRNPGRSTLTIGLVASATFLIVAISAFRIAPSEKGTGGFDVIAESTRPILPDLNTPAGRRELRISGDADVALADSEIISLRVKGGDEASCLNLYQSTQPRILGVTPSMVEYVSRDDTADFAWADTAAETPEEEANPWRLLEKPLPVKQNIVPVVIDKNTAMYGLHLGGVGSEFEITDDGGQKITFHIVGLLDNSILQGNLLIGEQDFRRLYPGISGRRMFLAKSKLVKPDRLIAALEGSLAEQGMDATDARLRLRDLLAVQNTYLSTFQSLGALGLLLGTFGLATVQLRSVLERRGELALMRSAGFRRTRLAQMVMLENIVLLVGGLLTGLIAALLAVLPHWWVGGAAVPLGDLAIYLGIVLVVGIVSGLAAVAATLRAPLLGALRGN